MAHKILMFTRRLPVLASFLLLSLGCASGPAEDNGAKVPTRPAPGSADAILATLLELEDRRSDGNGELERLALSGDPEVRVIAVRALGRLGFPEHAGTVTAALRRALTDPDPRVRAASAFGMGLRQDPESSKYLIAQWKDSDPNVRARLVEAASRFEDLALREEVLYALADPSPLVRAEAAIAPTRWDTDSSAAAVVDSALANLLTKAPASLRQARWGLDDATANAVEPEDPEVIWRALSTLSRRKSQRAREVYHLWCRAPQDTLARIFATRGLANLESTNEEDIAALQACLEDDDWRVVVEATRGLARFPEPSSIIPMERALEHSNTNVRLEVAAALGFFAEEQRLARPILETCLVDLSPNVQASAIRSLARLFPNEAAADLETRALNRAPQVRKAVAQACEFLQSSAALQLLDKLSRDADKAVAFAAVEGYGNFLAQGGRSRATGFLTSEDNGLRLAAVLALGKGPLTVDLAPLHGCYRSSHGDITDEIRYEILKIAALLGGDQAYEILIEGRRSNRAYNRTLADHLLRENYPNMTHGTTPPAPARRGQLPTLRPGADNPRVEVRTSRGTLLFELFEDVAPVHVHNFLELSRSSAYDGLNFHRVVPDFVVQGADYRGDGNGGESWRSEPLRHEFNAKKYLEGSLGMPRNADPDSGGSQWFVTHVPTPHLDGRYTLFGHLLQGFDVLSTLEEGDTILSVRVRGE